MLNIEVKVGFSFMISRGIGPRETRVPIPSRHQLRLKSDMKVKKDTSKKSINFVTVDPDPFHDLGGRAGTRVMNALLKDDGD